MTEAAVIAVINEICGKIGTTADYVIPKLSTMEYYSHFFGLFACIALSLVCAIYSAIVLIISIKKDMDYFDVWDMIQFSTWFSIPASLITMGFAIWNGYEMVMWKVAPEAKAIEYIINMIEQRR